MPEETGEPRSDHLSHGIEKETSSLSSRSAIAFEPFPHDPDSEIAQNAPVWRVRFSQVDPPYAQFGLELNGEVVLGRDTEDPQVIDLKKHLPDVQGISRKHIMLRPTPTNLYAIDLNSTNGTWRNGRSIGINNPTPISNGDILDLGGMQILINITERPNIQTGILQQKLDLADALSQIAKAITSQLHPDEVLHKVLETAQTLAGADEAAIWLIDENSGELFLEAEQGIEDDQIRRMRLPASDDNLVGRVLTTSQPLRTFRKLGEEQIKVKTGYLVESLLFVPITLGGVTFGVIGTGQRKTGKAFSQRDEQLLVAIADFAAIAIQNARLYHATDQALARRVKELVALNEVARTVSSSLDLAQVYNVLVEQISKNWPVQHVKLYLYHEGASGLLPLTFGKNAQRPQPITKGLMWQVAQTRQSVMSNEPAAHPAYVPAADDIDGRAPESIVCVPLTIKERVVGVLSLLNKQNGEFVRDDLNLLEAFSHPIATALENARLFAESRRQQAAILATSQTIHEPLIILDEQGSVVVSNQAAQELLRNHMSQLFDGISRSVGRTVEVKIGNNTYLGTSQHMPDVGTISVMQNITYVKRLEKDRAEFMRALSHDLKSPLTSIKGFAQLLNKVMPLNEKGAQFVDQIVSATDRMLEMIYHLLQLTHEDAMELEHTVVDMGSLVVEAIHDMNGAALSKSIDVLFETVGKPFRIMGDPIRLYHLTLNLVDNAIKYSPPQTTVRVLLTYAAHGVTLEVQDEGYGLAEEDLPRLFEKHFRGKHTAHQEGSGVGLSVVKAIVVAHEGEISAANRPEGGAVFKVQLPVKLRVME